MTTTPATQATVTDANMAVVAILPRNKAIEETKRLAGRGARCHPLKGPGTCLAYTGPNGRYYVTY